MKVALAPPSRPHDTTIAFSAMSAVVLAMARLWDFERMPFVHCPLKTLAHVPCPTCGMTRAFVRTMHGDFARAVEVSPLGFLLCLGAIALVAYAIARATVLRRGIEITLRPLESRIVRIGFVASLAANWAYLVVSGAAN